MSRVPPPLRAADAHTAPAQTPAPARVAPTRDDRVGVPGAERAGVAR